ncbi:MAG: bacterial transcriptional activator domain-containing protein [Chloroflexi bacterium]|nr:bacterial transcriptional activator domain-containing protein [Chloroflexota bacterium]
MAATTTHLWLDPQVAVDLREMTDLAACLQRGSIACNDRRISPGTFSGDLLPDWYDDWLHFEREHVRQVRLHALDTLCVRLTDAREYGLALQAGLAAVAAEPLRESAQRTLIRVHLAEQNNSEALRQYRAYQRLIKDELGLSPSQQMRDLVAGLQSVRTAVNDEMQRA